MIFQWRPIDRASPAKSIISIPRNFLDATRAERVDRYAQFALVAAKEAVTDAGLRMDQEKPHRVGVIVGAGIGGMVMGEREITQLYESRRPHRVHPNFIPTITLNSASGIVAMAHGAKGPNLTISTACSSSAHAFGQGLPMHSERTGGYSHCGRRGCQHYPIGLCGILSPYGPFPPPLTIRPSVRRGRSIVAGTDS